MNNQQKLALKWTIGSLIVGLTPFLITIVAGLIAGAIGCTLNEGFAEGCYDFGIDLNRMLYYMGIAFWFGIVALPFMSVLFILSLVWFFKEIFFQNRG